MRTDWPRRRRIGIAIIGLAAAAVLVVWAMAPRQDVSGGEGEPQGAPGADVEAVRQAPRIVVAATPTPTPIPVVPLRDGPELPLPNDVALLLELICLRGEGFCFRGLARVYSEASGVIRAERLVQEHELVGLVPEQGRLVPDLDPSGFGDVGEPLQGSPEGSQIIAAVCYRWECDPYLTPGTDPQTALLRSGDGGVTWAHFGTVNGRFRLARATPDGVMLQEEPFGTEAGNVPGYRLFPGLRPVVPPQEGARLREGVNTPEPLWCKEGGPLLGTNGEAFLALLDCRNVLDIVPDPSGSSFAVTMARVGPDGKSQALLGVVDRDGRLQKAFTRAPLMGIGDWDLLQKAPGRAMVHHEAQSAVIVAWLDANQLVGHAEFASSGVQGQPQLWRPAQFDLSTGTVHPLAVPSRFDGQAAVARRILAVQRGPFARVVNTGSCLNIRAAPGAAGHVLSCTTDGVLLRDLGETQAVAGETWRRVRTPGGIEGWAGGTYLEVRSG